MKKSASFFVVALLLVVAFVFIPSQQASAHALCSDTPVAGSTVTAYGSTSAHVVASLWHKCSNDSYYASMTNYADANGFAFHGMLQIWTNGGSGVVSGQPVNGSGIYTTSWVYHSVIANAQVRFYNNNGVFYSCGGGYLTCTNNEVASYYMQV